jgi:tetratricopeptide (TPR) repeat protein
VHAPRFTAKEILELVQAHGAPTRLTNINFAEFLRVSTGGLPVVVAAVVQFLISKNWISEAKDIESLFKRDYAKSIRQDARKLIEATVPDLDARELLYRLTCVIGPISRLHVERVGKVAAEIKLSMEKLNHLVGLWVQPYGTDKYLLSPLVDNGLANLLDSNTRKRVHRALGGIILRGKLAVLDIVICVTHFHEAAMNSTAAVVLLQAIIKIMDYDSEVPNESIMSALWAEVPLPGDIDINLRLNLRAAQIALADKRNKDCSFLNGDLRELLDQAQGDDKAQLGMFMASCLLVTRFFRKDPRMSNRYILTALRSAPKAVLPDGSKLSIPTEMSLESMLWGTAAAAKSVAEVEDWLETVGQLSPGQVQALSGSQFAADNSTVLCDSVWLREYHKPHGERDWDAVEKMMKLIERRSRDLGLDLLNAAALRTQIVILAEQRNRLADAVSMAEETLRTATSDGVRFLIEEATGRQLAYAGRWEEALLWMGRAIGRDVDGLTPLRRNLLVTISEGVARYDLAAAVGYARQAVEIAKSADLVSAQVAEALGEYAIALWGADQREMSFVQWQEAVQLLVGAVDRPPAHTETFLAFLHAAGYFSSMVIFGSPPNADYEAPEPGFFLNTFRFRPETYMISQNRLLYFHTAMFAEGVQDTDAAWRWAKLALGGNSSEVESDLRRPFVWLTIAPAILAGDYGYAIEKAYSTLVPVSSTNDSGNSPAPPSVAPEILARGPLEVSLILCFVPLAFRLATVRFDREISVDLEAVNRCVEGLSGDADEWKEAARLVKSILSNTVPWREFFQAGGKHYSENHVTLGALCFVGSILSAPEGQSLYSQIDLARILDKLFETRPSIRYKILLPFFQKYWDSAITSGSATFRTSAEYTRRNFDEAVASPVRVRLKEIFKSMVFCIGLSLPSNLRNWLEA